MKNTVILIHKKREDLKELIKNFQDTYLYICWQTDIESTWVKKIKTMPYHEKNVLGSGIQKIFDDLPGYSIIIVNENTTIDDIRNLYAQLQGNQCMIISANDPGKIISKKKNTGVKIITGLFNIVHRQKAENVMSNVQAIPADYVKNFLNLKGDTCNTLLSQRFIIKDQKLNFKYIEVQGSVFTDVPDTFFGYLKCIFIICFVFIKFMLSSVSAFLLDYALSLGGYNLWSPLIVDFFANLNFPASGVRLDVAIISTGIAPYTERYVRWCERTVSEIIAHFLLDLLTKK